MGQLNVLAESKPKPNYEANSKESKKKIPESNLCRNAESMC